MSRHVYQNEPAVLAYDRTHGFVDSEGNWLKEAETLQGNVVDFISTRVMGMKSVSIIDIGVGHGGWFFIPLVRKLLDMNKLEVAVGLDNSREMLKRLQSTLSDLSIDDLRLKPVQLAWNEISANDGTQVRLVHRDVESLIADGLISRDFDILLIMGVLHHTINWRQTLSFVTELLRPGGLLVLSERDHESAYLDGNFYGEYREDTPWNKLWQHYYTERAQLGAPWDPEIRVSDMRPILHMLLASDFRLLAGNRGVSGAAENDRCELRDSWKAQYSPADISRWLSSPALSNFYRSLDEETINKLLASSSEKMDNPEAPSFIVDEGWEFYVLQKG